MIEVSFFPFLFSLEKAVAKILPFRMDNSGFLDPIWNKNHIERVEVVVKETLDVKGEEEERWFPVESASLRKRNINRPDVLFCVKVVFPTTTSTG